MAHVVDIPLQEVRDLLDRGAERESVRELGNVNRGPRPCMLSAHGQPPVCLRANLGGRLSCPDEIEHARISGCPAR
jgi:hypothetical protein